MRSSKTFALSACATIVAATSAHTQGFQCPPPSVQVSGGGGFMCQCPDGSYASIIGCPSFQTPNWQPPPPTRYQPPPEQREDVTAPTNARETLILRAFEALGNLVTRGAQPYDSQAGSLSAQLPRGNIAPPPNKDAARALAELIGKPTSNALQPTSKNDPLGTPGQLVDPFTGRTVQLQPPKSQSSQSQPSGSQGAPGSYSACAGTSTFASSNQAYCEMGGYIYFQNGAVLKAN